MEAVPFPKLLQVAALELNALFRTKALPPEFEGARLGRATLVHDLDGEPLFRRIALLRGTRPVGYADVAVHPAIGGPLLAVTHGVEWDERAVLRDAAKAARRQRKTLRFDEARIVAYSFPKLAVQFLKDGHEVQMLEWRTWEPVPPAKPRAEEETPHFARWSLLGHIGKERGQKNANALEKRIAAWEKAVLRRRGARMRKPYILGTQAARFFPFPRFEFDARALHYSGNDADHATCYELRGQLTGVWCVAASVQMVLDFYRYNYAQTRVADELGLGTLQNPNGLPYANDGDVVTVLQDLTSNALTASMNTAPTWAEFHDEIDANRPLVSFIPGHSRTVAGYLRFAFWGITFRGLVVYDPWPPTTGVITTWENFDTQTYRRTFTAHVTLV